jgi:hypothetical protein
MRKLAFILLFPVLGMAVDSQASLNSVAGMTGKVPGEFAADALIRLAGVDSA